MLVLFFVNLTRNPIPIFPVGFLLLSSVEFERGSDLEKYYGFEVLA